MSFKVTTVRLPEETLEGLMDLTEKLGKDRSDVMREALKIGFDELKRRYALELYREGRISFGRMSELTNLSHRDYTKS